MRVDAACAVRPRWAAAVFPPGLDEALAQLRARVLSRVSSDGAVRGRCDSRVLETTLLLTLLDRTGGLPEHRNALAGYLRSRQHEASPLDRFLIGAALHDGDRPDTGSLVEDVLASAPSFTTRRKRAMLDACSAVLGVAQPSQLDPQAFDRAGLHYWAAVLLTAVKTVLADAAGQRGLIRDEDVRILLDTQRPGPVWEGNLLISIWVLHALHRLPRTGHTVDAGLRRVLGYQRDDGGIPFVADLDTWTTALAGVALTAAGTPPAQLRPLADYLAARQRPAGGWSATRSASQTDADTTAVAVQFLHTVDPGYQDAVEAGCTSLHALCGADGGFPTYLPGAPSETGMTAAVVDALATRWPAREDAIRSGLGFIATRQVEDGAFPPDWSLSRHYTIFRVLLAASRPPGPGTAATQRMAQRALALVKRAQNPDGGWGQQPGRPSDPLSTAYALISLCQQDDPRAAAQATAYLLHRQRGDGSFTATPDTVGPRPFTYAVPAQYDIFVLLALGHLRQRIQRGTPGSPHALTSAGSHPGGETSPRY
jgi:squalene-hopene/tetraprenyl-beta-curcumene cyclase